MAIVAINSPDHKPIRPRSDSEYTTAVLFTKAKNSEGQDTVACYHQDRTMGKR